MLLDNDLLSLWVHPPTDRDRLRALLEEIQQLRNDIRLYEDEIEELRFLTHEGPNRID